MPPLTTTPIASLDHFSQVVSARIAVVHSPMWFRGCGDASHQLLPSLYRHPTKSEAQELISLEGDIMERFRQRSIPFHDRVLNSKWDSLFFMQHYGVPTRLLDWTENPYIALFFALTSARPSAVPGPVSYDSDAAVWLMAPTLWNHTALNHIAYDGGPLSPQHSLLSGYEPGRDLATMNLHPVALYGNHNSQRIVAQRGVFAIFGKNVTSMEECFEHNPFADAALEKLIIHRNTIIPLLETLMQIGYTDSVIYPDLPGLALEIKRFFRFKV